jgi:hypothetical protein
LVSPLSNTTSGFSIFRIFSHLATIFPV